MRRWMMAASVAAMMASGSARAMEASGGPAAPVDLKIADDARNGDGRFSGVDYAKSDRFGRAWLVLHYPFQGQCLASEGLCELDAPLQVSVPGLAYDANAKQVVYRRAGAEPVVCASRRRGFLGAESLAPTGRCTTRVVKIDRLVDDGFAGRRERREEIHFAVQSP
jgi:hypothetical protein